jgi:hypothetical protein
MKYVLAAIFIVVCSTGCVKPGGQEVQNIHTVECVYEHDEVRVFHIHVPSEVRDVEAFAKGFCDSIAK